MSANKKTTELLILNLNRTHLREAIIYNVIGGSRTEATSASDSTSLLMKARWWET